MLSKKLSLQRGFILFVVIIFVVQLLQILYFQRATYLQPYDIAYWKDRVEHSRYYLPLSNRGIGDDGFYAYAGYKILQGVDPTKLVFDKPALGITILGLAESLYNPASSGLVFGLLCLLLTFVIVYKLTKKVLAGLLTMVFLAVDPLFFQSMSTSQLDLPQLFFLLVNIYCLQIGEGKRKYQLISVFFSGLALGICAQIKIPVFFPFVILPELWWLFKRYGKVSAITFLLGNILSLIPGYIPYAIHGYSFIAFLKIQKYIFAFYQDSQLQVHIGAIWQYLFSGTLPGIVDGISSRIAEWTIIYPIMTFIGVGMSIKMLFSKKEEYLVRIFAVIVLISLGIDTFIPTFPRYLILILPFFYFFMIQGILTIGKIKAFIIFSILLICALLTTFLYFHQSPSSFLSYFYTNFSEQYFQDVYKEDVDAQTKSRISMDNFNQVAYKTFSDAKIKDITIKQGVYPDASFSNHVFIPVTITYKTEYLGNFIERKNIELVKENSVWQVKWHWDYLLNGFNINRHVVSKRIVGKRGRVIDSKGNIIAQDTPGYLVSFNPSLMDGKQEQSMLSLLNRLSYIGIENLQNAYLENPHINTYIPLFTTQFPLYSQDKTKLLSYKGIKLQQYPTRLFYSGNPHTLINTNYTECCTRIYSSYNYHGNDKSPGVESKYDMQLSGYDGGTLQIVDSNGKVVRTIIQKGKKDGENIVLAQ